MKQVLLIGTLALLGASPILAQVPFEAPRTVERTAQAQVAPDGPQVLHVTDDLMRMPEAQAALTEYHRRKAQGLLPRVPKRTGDEIGDVEDFRVINLSSNQYETHDFELRAKTDRFQLWVEVAELDIGNVTQRNVDDVAEALGNSTPSGSFNPNAGVIDNDEAIFGDPPNVDGDGLTDVLLVDVRDNFSSTGTLFVAGFVTPQDLSGPLGNQRDVLYLDTHPSLEFGADFLAQTASHEYQHLIHFNYDREELTFLNEGLSEWAEFANGYAGRNINYLENDREYNVNFFRFDDSGQLEDRQRGFRFLSYLASLFSTLDAGGLTRQGASGGAGIQALLDAIGANRSFADLLFDFHVANVVNDTGLDPRFGFTQPFHQAVRAVPTAEYDGRFGTETPTTNGLLRAGGVEYYVWDNVTDLMLTVNVSSGADALRLGAVTTQNGTRAFRSIDVGDTVFAGDYERIVVVATHLNPDACGPLEICARLDYSATWTTEQVFDRADVIYDTGIVQRTDPQTLEAYQLCTSDNLQQCESSRQANLFNKPSGGTLTSVLVGAYFLHDFAGNSVPANAPRDVRLVIWEDDGTGRPADTQLFSLEITDTRSSSGTSNTSGNVINFLEIDLEPFQSELATLPDMFHVGLMNTGNDGNYLVMGVTPFANGEEGNTDASNAVSFLSLDSFNNGQGGWAAFHQLQSCDEQNNCENILENRVLPIRASFLVPQAPVASEDADEVPDAVVLHQNFPNPFNPATTIRYALPQPADIRLAVYDLLGRRIATLVDGVQAAGEHAVQVDATTWASGLYLYTLEAAGQQQTRRMVLLK